jgi:hypothetical protein
MHPHHEAFQGVGTPSADHHNRSSFTRPPRVRPESSPPLRPSAPITEVVYDAVDRRLMDTFPASDAVARY